MLEADFACFVIKERPKGLLSAFAKHAGKISMSSVAAGQLLLWAKCSEEPDANQRVVEDFLSRLEILPFTLKAAEHYARIVSNWNGSCPLSEVAIRTAGHAISEGLFLVVMPNSNYEQINGLLLDHWVK